MTAFTGMEYSIKKYEAFLRDERMPIRSIVYEEDMGYPPPGYRGLQQHKVDAILERFESEGCRRNEYPVFICLSDDKYVCVDGKHRLEAGKAFLKENDQFWRALIFQTTDLGLLQYLRNSGTKLPPWSEGDVYQIIRYYESVGEHDSAADWMRRISPKKRNFVKWIGRLASSDQEGIAFAYCFNRLLAFPALLADVSLGISRLLPIYLAELSHYLDRVYRCWYKICGGRPEIVTVSTVRGLEGLYPQLSSKDVEFITDRFKNFHVFETVHDQDLRKTILAACLSHKGRILSLHTFFEDSKLLESSAQIMRSLLPKSCKASLRKYLWQNLHDRDRTLAQTIERRFADAYRRLWLFAWKHAPEVARTFGPKSSDHSRPSVFQKCPLVMAEFGKLAQNQGFDNSQISRLIKSPWKTQTIKRFLESLCQSQVYKTDDIDAAVNAIEPILDEFLRSTIPEKPKGTALAYRFGSHQDAERFGLPFEANFIEDRLSLELEIVYQPSWEKSSQQAKYVTSFGYLRNKFHCFFGSDTELPYTDVCGTHTGLLSLHSGVDESFVSLARDENGSLSCDNREDDGSSQSSDFNDLFMDASERTGEKRGASGGRALDARKALRDQ